MRVNHIVVAAAEAVYRREGMGPALREAIRAAFSEVKEGPNFSPENELRDVVNGLSAWRLTRVNP